MLPKHEKRKKIERRRIASFVVHEIKAKAAAKKGKSFLISERRKNPQRNIFIEKTFSGWFTI
jgi:hypothetical protein